MTHMIPKMTLIAMTAFIMASPTASAQEYHYTVVQTTAQTLLGEVTIYIGGVPLESVPADTLGTLTVYTMESDGTCMTQHNTRSYLEDFKGEITGSNPQSTVGLTWNWAGLTFLGDDAQHVSYNGGNSGSVDIGESEFVGTTVLDAIAALLESREERQGQILNPAMYQQLLDDLAAGFTNVQANEISASFAGSGLGIEEVLDDRDWPCP